MDPERAEKLSGHFAFGLVAGFGGACLSVFLGSQLQVPFPFPEQFLRYAMVGFVVGVLIGAPGYTIVERRVGI